MLVVFLCLVNGTTSTICLMKALAAFVVFAAFGLILRYALIDSLENRKNDVEASALEAGADVPSRVSRMGINNLDVIVPGTSVAELLAAQQREVEDDRAEDESAAA